MVCGIEVVIVISSIIILRVLESVITIFTRESSTVFGPDSGIQLVISLNFGNVERMNVEVMTKANRDQFLRKIWTDL